MQWHSAAEFFAMGGYALYVWGSVGACALALSFEVWLVRRRHRQLVQALQRQPRRRAAAHASPRRGAQQDMQPDMQPDMQQDMQQDMQRGTRKNRQAA